MKDGKKYKKFSVNLLKSFSIMILIASPHTLASTVLCPKGCKLCNKPEKCLECDIAFKIVNNLCIECRVNYCRVCAHDIESCTFCLQGYFKRKISTSIKDTFICEKCPQNCAICNSKTSCQKCLTLHKVNGDKGNCVLDKSSIIFIIVGGFLIGSLLGKCICSIREAYHSEKSSSSGEREIGVLITSGKNKLKKRREKEDKELEKLSEEEKSKKILQEKMNKHTSVIINSQNLDDEEEEEKVNYPLSSQRIPFKDLENENPPSVLGENPDIIRLRREGAMMEAKDSKGTFSFGGNLSEIGEKKVKVKPRKTGKDDSDEIREHSKGE